MGTTFLGLSLTYWAIPCLMLAIMWSFVWPSYRAAGASTWHYLLLRWGHAGTWLSLAAATFLAGTGLLGGNVTAAILGLLSVALYIGFLYATLTTQTPPKEDSSA